MRLNDIIKYQSYDKNDCYSIALDRIKAFNKKHLSYPASRGRLALIKFYNDQNHMVFLVELEIPSKFNATIEDAKFSTDIVADSKHFAKIR